MSDLLIAESVLLLALDDDKGTDQAAWSADPALSGALLFDLVDRGHLEEREGRLIAVSGPPPASPPLAAALEAIRAEPEPQPPKHWIHALPNALEPLRETIAEGLVARGVLSEQRHKVLGLFPTTRYPEADPGPERALRAELEDVLVAGREPAPRTRLLIALLVPAQLVRQAVPKDARKVAEERAKAVADSSAVGEAVGEAVAQIEAAVMTAVLAATTVSTMTVVNSS